MTLAESRTRNRRHAVDSGYAWLVDLCSMVLWFLASITMAGFGVYYLEFLDYFRQGEVMTSLIIAVHSVSVSLAGLVSAEVIGILGFCGTASMGCVIACVGFIVCFAAKNIYIVILGYGIITPTGVAFAIMTSALATQYYFEKWRSMAVGIAGTGASIGALVMPNLIRLLVDTYTLQGSLLVVSAFFLQGIPFAMLIRPVPGMKKPSNRDGDYTKQKCGVCSAILDFVRNVFDFSVLKDPRVTIYFFCMLLGHMTTATVYSFTVARGFSHGESKAQAILPMTVFGATNFAGRLFLSFIADKTSRLAIVSMCVVGNGLLLVISAIYYTHILYVICIGCTGITVGGFITISLSAVADITGLKKLPRALGVNSIVFGASGLITLPLAGWIVQETGNYDLLFLIIGLLTLCGGVILTSLTIYIHCRKRRQKQIEMEAKSQDQELT